MRQVKAIHPKLMLDEDICVVGSSAKLLQAKHGERIDSFKEVVRFNRAPVEGYEHYVGSRTTLYVMNPHVFACRAWQAKQWSKAGQPANFAKNLRNTRIVCCGPQSRELKYSTNAKNIHKSCPTYNVKYADVKTDINRQPTVGFAFLHLLLKSGFKPTLFGFYGIPGQDGDEGLTHYWEERKNSSHHHDYSKERLILKKLHEDEKIVWVQ